MPRRTNEEKKEALLIFAEVGRNYRLAVRTFNDRHRERYPMCRKYLRELVRKLDLTGNLNDKKRSGRPSIPLNTVNNVVNLFRENAQIPTRVAAEMCHISKSSVLRLLKKNRFFPYKTKLVQQLCDRDPHSRLQFCREISDIIARCPNFLRHVCFTDEATFMLHGKPNKQNTRFWSNHNPGLIRENHTQYPRKINVWLGILGNHIIGPIFIEENLTGPLYLQILQEQILPKINQIANDHPEEFSENITFQQDGATPHFFRPVREFLDENFPQSWIGRGGPIGWPARSPDLTPLDYFIWGYVKTKVYATQPENIEELKRRIQHTIGNITAGMLRNVREGFKKRIRLCQQQNGGHFAQLL